MMRFSIIVPVYNAEPYLEECLDSIRAQTCGDYEVICVNDGSSDASWDILQQRAFTDERIRVVDKANGGPSSARNDGIRLAQGDYLCFLDADDMLEPIALESLNRALENYEFDAVVFGWSYFPAGLADRFVREHTVVRDAAYPAFNPDLLFKEMSNPYLRLAVRREALAESGVMFDESLRVGEDALFLFSLYPRIGAVKLISDKLYRYRLPHEGSVMADYKDDVANLCMCDLDMAIGVFAVWNRYGLLEPYGSQLMNWFVRGQLYTILRQPPELREPLTALVRQLWRANFTNSELISLDVSEPTARLIRIVLAADDEGHLVISEQELSKALFAWRIDEYGVADLAVTAAERAASRLLAQRHMLLKSRRGDGELEVEEPLSLETKREAAHANEELLDDGFADDKDAETCESLENSVEQSESIDPNGSDEPLVSVIVPVFNVEKYLDQALESIEAQTLRAIEVICVNDGSTDGSLEIIRAHAARDRRIRVIDKPNGGYGSACNRGFHEARGTWIAIVEPDDWIAPEMYKAMTSFASSFEHLPDIVKTPYWRIWMPDTDQQRRVNCSYRGRIKPASQPFKLVDPGVTHLIIHHPSIWSALYRREFLERCGIRMREIPGAGWADNPFLVETLCQADAIVYLDEPFYHYREETPEKTANMALNNWRVSLDRWHDMADVYERLGIEDENICRAHVRRGFTYIGLVLEYHDLEKEDDVRERIVSVFERMDDALVFSEPNISPGSKELYAKLKGVPMPQVSPLPYMAEVVKGGLYNVANTGPAMTLDTLKSFVTAHAKREGK